jgi:hypothetical protein
MLFQKYLKLLDFENLKISNKLLISGFFFENQKEEKKKKETAIIWMLNVPQRLMC